MSKSSDLPTARQVAGSILAAFAELLGYFGMKFTYFLALLIAYLSWRMLPPSIAFLVVFAALCLLAVDEYREAKRA